MESKCIYCKEKLIKPTKVFHQVKSKDKIYKYVYWACRKCITSRVSKSLNKWREKHPDRVKAHRKVFVEIRAKRMFAEKCFCGKKGEAHHEDYSKPLEVIWLCREHHRKADKERIDL